MSINYYSDVNQKILKEFVKDNVIMCGTDIIEFILQYCEETKDAPFIYDDIENLYSRVCPECESVLEEIYDDEIEISHKWICECCGEKYDTKEDAMNCCYSDEESREDLEESDMIKEVWICPFCGEEHESEEDTKDCVCHWKERLYKCPYCGKYVFESETEEEMNKAYEWWFVTSFFAEKLKQHGEMVITGWRSVWGRGTTGQAIYLDDVVEKIAEEMKILEGMENDWSKSF